MTTKSYESSGFTVYRSILDMQSIAEISQRYKQVLEKAESGLASTSQPLNVEYCSALSFVTLEDDEGRKFLGSKTKEIIEKLSKETLETCSDDISYHVRLFHKSPLASGTSRHQDDAYRSNANNSLTFWIPLDDVTCDNGCLIYEEGSHRFGLLPHEIDPSDKSGNTLTITSNAGAPYNIYNAEMRIGDLSMHSPLVIHSSYKNSSSKPRRAVVVISKRLV